MTDTLIDKIKEYHQTLDNKTHRLLHSKKDDSEPIDEFYQRIKEILIKYNLIELYNSKDFHDLQNFSKSHITNAITDSDNQYLNRTLLTIEKELIKLIKSYSS